MSTIDWLQMIESSLARNGVYVYVLPWSSIDLVSMVRSYSKHTPTSLKRHHVVASPHHVWMSVFIQFINWIILNVIESGTPSECRKNTNMMPIFRQLLRNVHEEIFVRASTIIDPILRIDQSTHRIFSGNAVDDAAHD